MQVSGLRKLIGARAIATVPGLGHRFAMAIDGDDAAAAAQAPASPSFMARTNVLAPVDHLFGREGDVAAGWRRVDHKNGQQLRSVSLKSDSVTQLSLSVTVLSPSLFAFSALPTSALPSLSLPPSTPPQVDCGDVAGADGGGGGVVRGCEGL